MARVQCANPDGCERLAFPTPFEGPELCAICEHNNVRSDLPDEVEQPAAEAEEPEEETETTETESLTLGEFA